MGFSTTRRLILNFDQLQISFFDKDGLSYSDNIECVLSTFQTENPGK